MTDASYPVAPGRWLLIGGAGYIGSHVARSLYDLRGAVLVIDDLSSGEAARLPSEVPLVTCSVTNEAQLLRLLDNQPPFDVIMHFASLKNARASVAEPLAYWNSVVGGTASALRVTLELGIPAFVYASSCAIYGNQVNVTEETTPAPMSPYGSAKLAAEQLIRDTCMASGLRSTILRYFNVIGQDTFPHAQDISPGHLIPDMMQRMSLREPLSVAASQEATTDGTCLRDFVDVRDIAAAHVLAGRRLQWLEPGELVEDFNLSTGVPASALEVVRLLADQMRYDAKVSVRAASPGDPSRIYGAAAHKAARDLGWAPRFSLKESIASLKTAER